MNNKPKPNKPDFGFVDPRIVMNAYELAWHAATYASRNDTYIMHAPDNLSGLTVIERHLLINDNNALDLDHDQPTYPATTDELK